MACLSFRVGDHDAPVAGVRRGELGALGAARLPVPRRERGGEPHRRVEHGVVVDHDVYAT